MKSFLFLALGLSALVEYRFGQSYGYFYYDFSLNQYHGCAYSYITHSNIKSKNKLKF